MSRVESLDGSNQFYPTKFARAIETGDSVLVQSMIDNGFVDASARLPGWKNPPALVYALQCHQLRIVEILLRANARIDDADSCGLTACHIAASWKNIDLLRLFLRQRPNLNLALKDACGTTALQISCSPFFEPTVLMLIKAGASLDGVDICKIAIFSVACLSALLDRGVVLRNIRSFYGTLLHTAVIFCADTDVLQMLLDKCDIELEKRNRNGSTCTHLAVVSNNVGALELFIHAGANINSTRNHDAFTPLHMVKDDKCAIALVAAGADLDRTSLNGSTPLRCAIFNRMWSCAEIILAAGANLDTNSREDLLQHRREYVFDTERIETICRDIAKKRLDFVRYRALQVCIGLKPLALPVLPICEILLFSCGPVSPLIAFHHWWKIAAVVKHFFNENE